MVQVSETQSSTEASLSSTAPAESTHQTSRYRIDIHRQRYRISRETVRQKLHLQIVLQTFYHIILLVTNHEK